MNLAKQTVILQDFHFFPLMPFPGCCSYQPFKGRLRCFQAFVVKKLSRKLITVPHSAFKYKQLCLRL